MGDIKNPKLLYIKGILFFLLGVLTTSITLMLYPDWRLACLLGICVWAFSRTYYFVFYVIQHDVDPNFRFAGLIDFAKYLLRKRYQDHNKQD